MSRLHELVVLASDTTDLEKLSGFLVEACILSIAAKVMPHQNFAVRFISFQIGFAGDGDFDVKSYYKDILDYSKENVEIDQPEGAEPSEPSRKSS